MTVNEDNFRIEQLCVFDGLIYDRLRVLRPVNSREDFFPAHDAFPQKRQIEWKYLISLYSQSTSGIKNEAAETAA
jgi:hypothetical protein